MNTVSLPQARIPLGWALIAGRKTPVEIDYEWLRALTDLVERAGGVTGEQGLGAFVPLLEQPARDPAAADALRAVDELRNELASTRQVCDELRGLLHDLTAAQDAARGADDLRARITQIEDRLL
jgi:hypothetical protein